MADPSSDSPGQTPRSSPRVRLRVALAALLGLAVLPLARSAPPRPLAELRAGFFVAPNGRPSGDGSKARPWDLATALAQPAALRPGDTVWLRGGTYRGSFTSTLTGAAGAPLVLRQSPGERATIDGNFVIQGTWAWYWGFEVTCSDPVRTTPTRGSDARDIPRSSIAVTVSGPNVSLINLAVHDLGDGIEFWQPARDSEIYGCVLYNNGWQGPDRGHGHGIYIQNREGTKRVTDVVSFNNFATGMKAYGEQGWAVGISFDGIVSFNNGSLRPPPEAREYNLLVGTAVNPAANISLTHSCFYHPPGVVARNVCFGYTSAGSEGAVIRDNYLAGGDAALEIRGWRSAAVSGNTFYAVSANAPGRNSSLAQVRTPDGVPASAYRWENNTYFDGTRSSGQNGPAFPFNFNDALNAQGGGWLTFEEWKRATGFDGTSRYSADPPAETRVVVRPNKYEPGRANIAVYNWERKDSVAVDLSGTGLKNGDAFEVVDAQNYFGAPVARGVYDGSPVPLPMKLETVAQPVGKTPVPPRHTGPEFGAFVVRPHPWKPGIEGNEEINGVREGS
jgi:hypothetical protein